jgi:hypothetical protein
MDMGVDLEAGVLLFPGEAVCRPPQDVSGLHTPFSLPPSHANVDVQCRPDEIPASGPLQFIQVLSVDYFTVIAQGELTHRLVKRFYLRTDAIWQIASHVNLAAG